LIGVPVSRIEIAIVEQPGSTGTNNNSEEALTLAAKNQDVWQTVQLSGAADLQRRWDWQLWDFTCPIDTQKGGKPKFVVARAGKHSSWYYDQISLVSYQLIIELLKLMRKARSKNGGQTGI
jgi:S-formylglutathione hydrolase FrmB